MNLLLNLCFVGERDRSKFDLPRFHRVVVLFSAAEPIRSQAAEEMSYRHY